MKTMNDHDQPINPRLQELLNLLRSTPARDEAAKAKGEARFMAEIEAIFQSDPTPTRPISTGWAHNIHMLKEKLTMTTLARRTTLTAITAILAILVFLFGGFGMTAYASQSALPGDALYSLKTGLEQARMSMERDPAAQAMLYMKFAENRLEEMSALVQTGRYDDVAETAQDYSEYVKKALEAIQELAKSDPAQAAELSAQINASLTDYTQVLSSLLASVPEKVQQEVRGVLQTSQDGPESGIMGESGNENENGNDANENDDNSNASDDDNENEANTNDEDSNENDTNANTDDDDNGNENESACVDDNNDGVDDVSGSQCSDDDDNANDDNGNDDNGNDDDDNGNDDNGNDDDGNGNDDDGNGNGNSNDDDGNGNGNSNDD